MKLFVVYTPFLLISVCLLHIQVHHTHFRSGPAPLCGLDLRDSLLCQLLVVVFLEDLQLGFNWAVTAKTYSTCLQELFDVFLPSLFLGGALDRLPGIPDMADRYSVQRNIEREGQRLTIWPCQQSQACQVGECSHLRWSLITAKSTLVP